MARAFAIIEHTLHTTIKEQRPCLSWSVVPNKFNHGLTGKHHRLIDERLQQHAIEEHESATLSQESSPKNECIMARE